MNTNIQTLIQKAIHDVKIEKDDHINEASNIDAVIHALTRLNILTNDSVTKYLIGTLIDAHKIDCKLSDIEKTITQITSSKEIKELQTQIIEYKNAISVPDNSTTQYKYISNIATKATTLATSLNSAYIVTNYKHDSLNTTAIYAASLATDLSTIASNMDNPIFNAASSTLHEFARELNALDQKIKTVSTGIAKASEIITTILSTLPFLAKFFPFLS